MLHHSEIMQLQYIFFYVLVCLSQAEENRQKENEAAVQIQSWFRSCRVRAYLRYNVCVWWEYAKSVNKTKQNQTKKNEKRKRKKKRRDFWHWKNISLNILYTNLSSAFSFRG